MPAPNNVYVACMPIPCTIHSPSVGPMMLPRAYLPSASEYTRRGAGLHSRGVEHGVHGIQRNADAAVRCAHAFHFRGELQGRA